MQGPQVCFRKRFCFRTSRFQASHAEIIVLGIFRTLSEAIVRLKVDLAIWSKHTSVWYIS
jgi:hypothetical protein